MRPLGNFVLSAQGVSKRFRAKETGQMTTALADVALDVQAQALTALVGPDGAGKTTLLRLAAGLMEADEGTLTVLGIDARRDPQMIQNRISYMPQRFGLYDDLSVQENLDLYADLHGVSAEERRERYPVLMHMTNLAEFTRRPAGKLSGGMKQKLGLACTLVRSPELLLLDEPTVGVDPLSRRDLWRILDALVRDEHLSVLISTAYLQEAARCARVALLHEGRLLAEGAPDDIRDRARGLCFAASPLAGQPARRLQARLLDDVLTIDAVPRGGEVRFIRQPQAVERGDPTLSDVLAGASARPVEPSVEDGFMLILKNAAVVHQDADKVPERVNAGKRESRTSKEGVENGCADASTGRRGKDDVVIDVKDLVRKFGDFTAVNSISFSVNRGEVFGLLGPNGAGKTTTFRMLCGLLPATSGRLSVAGYDLRTARARARRQIGYVSQKFALYRDLTVDQNLVFFGEAYGLYGSRLRDRMQAVMAQFELQGRGPMPAGRLPGGFRQRLAMATSLLHEPDILFLDEPTSGADPRARREFWRRITALAGQGTTVIITTHFLEEAEYCDRIVIQDAGRILALGTPREIRRRAGAMKGDDADSRDADGAVIGATGERGSDGGGAVVIDMEQAFIRIVEQARR